MDEILVQLLGSIQRHLNEEDRRLLYDDLIPAIYMHDPDLVERIKIGDPFFEEVFDQWITEQHEEFE